MKSFFLLFINFFSQYLVRGADCSRILKEFQKNSKAIWFLRSEQTALVTIQAKWGVIVSEEAIGIPVRKAAEFKLFVLIYLSSCLKF